jgi:hypothetical protein
VYVGAVIKTWVYIANGYKEFIGESFDISFKFGLSECTVIAHSCHIKTQRKFELRSNSST